MLRLNDHLYSKSCVFLLVANFWGLIAGLASIPTLSWAFTIGHICITKTNGAFTRGGCLSLLANTRHIFSFSCILPCDLVGRCPTVPSPPNQIPNAVLIITMHSHPFHAMSPCICNAMCHFMPKPCHIYDEFCMDNSTHAYRPCIMDNYINQHKISKRSHISCQHICTHIYQHQQVITNLAMTYFIL